MNDYNRLRDWLAFRAQEFDQWLRRHRHLSLASRQTAYAAFCAEMQPIAHDLRVYEEAAAYRKTVLEEQEWKGII